MAERPHRRRPITVPVEAKRVEGTIDLTEMVGRIHRHAAVEARRAKRDPAVPENVEIGLRNVSRLARELADELRKLEEHGPLPPGPSSRGRRRPSSD